VPRKAITCASALERPDDGCSSAGDEGYDDITRRVCRNLGVALFDSELVGHLDLDARIRLDQALRYALDIQY
jgi:hypothetical protein